MTRNIVLPTAALTLLVAFAAVPIAAEGLTVVSKVSGPKGTPPTSTQYIAADGIRTSDGRYDTIFDLASGRIIQVDHKKKAWAETTLEEMRAHFAELEEMMAGNPMMEMMAGKATEVDVQKGSGGQSVAGYDCDWYALTLGKKIRFDICAAPGLKAPAGYYDASKMAYAAMGPMGSRFEKLWEEMKEIDGFPLVTKMDTKIMGMKLVTESEATEVRKGPIPAGAFDPPAGYKKKKSPYEKK